MRLLQAFNFSKTCIRSDFGDCCGLEGKCGSGKEFYGDNCQDGNYSGSAVTTSSITAKPSATKPPLSISTNRDYAYNSGFICKGSKFGDCCLAASYCRDDKYYCACHNQQALTPTQSFTLYLNHDDQSDRLDKAKWDKAELLIPQLANVIPSMANLKSFSLIRHHRTMRNPLKPWSEAQLYKTTRSTISSLLKSLPESCISLELAVGDINGSNPDPDPTHLCEDLRRLLPRLQHVHINLDPVCDAMLGTLPTAWTCGKALMPDYGIFEYAEWSKTYPKKQPMLIRNEKLAGQCLISAEEREGYQNTASLVEQTPEGFVRHGGPVSRNWKLYREDEEGPEDWNPDAPNGPVG
ncbi:hypothetical protein FOC4_g10000825 [Fusarium odoratissimum]|uniref:Chitin-binding type-1 domain-containing protein n=1 Tax=Fusarium oxysporum f. sp. cubense (strain race 4) TaxID=2502994 RepID=N1S9H9_FUSC4|nr:hypothetical protein FOC4_g10000817 [Fusarium odoratissimum]EMT73468.1 hypothetical protein FOC4_g10000825 [Fusarium odoratissimum]